jgi:hypothetical protein
MANLPALGCFRNALEVRPLPSAGVTRHRRYYGPVRLPQRPGLALAGCRLAGRPATVGDLPCCGRSPVPTCRRHYPGGIVSEGGSLACDSRQRPSPSPCRVGSHIRCFEACSAFTRVTACLLAGPPMVTLSSGGFGGVVTSAAAPLATGWSDSCRVGLTPTQERHLSTAHKGTLLFFLDGPSRRR